MTAVARVSIGFADDVTAYELRRGRPNQQPISRGDPGWTAFQQDPEIEEETIRLIGKPRVHILERRGASAMLRDDDGRPVTFGAELALEESVLSPLAEPHRYPILSVLRERLRRWRF